jgi:hypothetical protein
LRNSDLARPLVNRFLPDYAFMGAVFIARKPPIDSDPASKQFTTYDFANNADRERAVAEIRSVTGNGSFISRSLLVISNNGLSKKFETITGEDGLTFGVKDFTSGGVFPLLQLINQQNPEAIETAFGSFTPNVLDRKFLDANTSSRDDHGLIAIREFRKGLDQILTDRALHGAQLQRYRMESVEPALAAFNKREFQTEFSLAAMIGVANSFGPGSEGSGKGMIGRLDKAKEIVGSDDEGQIMRAFVEAYALRDADESRRAATERLVQIGFGDTSGNLPSQDELAHSGRRVLLLFQIFPLKEQRPFTELGNFVLAPDEGSQ